MRNARNILAVLVVAGLLGITARSAQADHGVVVYGNHYGNHGVQYRGGPTWHHGSPYHSSPHYGSRGYQRRSYYPTAPLPPVYLPPRAPRYYYRPNHLAPYYPDRGGFSIYTPRFGFSIGF